MKVLSFLVVLMLFALPLVADDSRAAAGEPETGAGKPAAPEFEKGPEVSLLNIPRPSEGEEGLDSLLEDQSPGRQLEESLRRSRQGTNGGNAGPEQGTGVSDPDLNTPFPTIFSDTRGVDFGPYLTRVVIAVRNNWRRTTPDSVRLGEQGRVVIVFTILSNGDVPNGELRVVSSSGRAHLDRAAMVGIQASQPFQPLPSEFTGDKIVLQFSFFYNMPDREEGLGASVQNIPAPPSAWTVKIETSPMDDSSTVILSLPAEDLAEGWLSEERPILLIQCVERETNVAVYLGMQPNPKYGGRFNIRIRLDDNKPETHSWSASTNGKALFAIDPRKLAHKIARAKTLLFEFTPFNANPAVVTFSVHGLEKHLGAVAKACGWVFPSKDPSEEVLQEIIHLIDQVILAAKAEHDFYCKEYNFPARRKWSEIKRESAYRLFDLEKMGYESTIEIESGKRKPDLEQLGYEFTFDQLIRGRDIEIPKCKIPEDAQAGLNGGPVAIRRMIAAGLGE